MFMLFLLKVILTKAMPETIKISEMIISGLKMFSPNIRPDRRVPKTGIRRLKIEIILAS